MLYERAQSAKKNLWEMIEIHIVLWVVEQRKFKALLDVVVLSELVEGHEFRVCRCLKIDSEK